MNWAKALGLMAARTRATCFGQRDDREPRIEREHRNAAHAARAGALFSPAGSAWIWRTDRSRRLHAAGLGGNQEVGLERRLLSRSRLFTALSCATPPAARDLSPRRPHPH